MRLSSRQLGAVVAAALVFAIVFGVRQSQALFIGPLNTATGLGIATISFAFAAAQLVWGVTQPLAGAAADRWGTGRVIALGGLLVVLGTALTPYMRSAWGLVLVIGVLAAGGSGLAGMGVLMSAVGRMVPPAARGMASATINAGGSFGQFAVVPLAQWLSGSLGWVGAIGALAALAFAVVPLAAVLRTQAGAAGSAAAAAPAPELSLGQAMRGALADRSFVLLMLGFTVCGFHVAFLATHLPGIVAACGLPPEVAAWSLSLIGLFNIAGSFAAGWAIGRWRMKSVLAALYAARAAALLVFLFAPKTASTLLLFSVAMGLTYLATVPPTVGLVGRMHGMRYLATLFGLVMLAHQVGAFFGAWLGGQIYQATASYDWMFFLDIVLAVGAALLHLPIREQPVLATARAA